MTRRRAGELGRLGLGRGDRVLWSTASSIPAVVVNIAALRAGLVVVPVNPSYTERELAHVVGDVRPAAAIVDDRDRAAVLCAGRRWRHRGGHARPGGRRGFCACGGGGTCG